MKSKSSGFSLLELAAVIIVISVIAAIIMPMALDVFDNARMKTLTSVAGAMTIATADNYAARMASGFNTDGGVANPGFQVANCQDALNTVPSGIDQSKYGVAAATPVASGATVSCSLVNLDHPSDTVSFLVYGSS
jgi:MSHA pilin protein MshA